MTLVTIKPDLGGRCVVAGTAPQHPGLAARLVEDPNLDGVVSPGCQQQRLRPAAMAPRLRPLLPPLLPSLLLQLLPSPPPLLLLLLPWALSVSTRASERGVAVGSRSLPVVTTTRMMAASIARRALACK